MKKKTPARFHDPVPQPGLSPLCHICSLSKAVKVTILFALSGDIFLGHPVSPFQMTESDESTGPEKAACMAPTHVRWRCQWRNNARHKGRGVFCVGSAEGNLPTWNRNADIFEERRRRRRIVAGNTDERAWLLSNSKARQERDATYITLLSRAKISLPSFANPRVIHATPVPEINTILLQRAQRASFPHLPNHYRLAYFLQSHEISPLLTLLLWSERRSLRRKTQLAVITSDARYRTRKSREYCFSVIQNCC